MYGRVAKHKYNKFKSISYRIYWNCQSIGTSSTTWIRLICLQYIQQEFRYSFTWLWCKNYYNVNLYFIFQKAVETLNLHALSEPIEIGYTCNCICYLSYSQSEHTCQCPYRYTIHQNSQASATLTTNTCKPHVIMALGSSGFTLRISIQRRSVCHFILWYIMDIRFSEQTILFIEHCIS